MRELLMGLLSLAPQEAFVPPRFTNGTPPGVAVLAPNGGLVGLELLIAPSGIVQDAIVIDDSPPFTEEMKRIVRLWKFEPARLDGRPAAARVAVVALFRAPILLGGAPPPPKRLSSPSPEIPYPTSTSTPAFPPQALQEGVVMLEVEVDERGAVASVESVRHQEGFAEVAIEAARQFRFQPAERGGRPVRARALLVFGFPQPVTPMRPRAVVLP
jgi:TonB family protein